MFKMVEAGPHQVAIEPHQVDSNLHQAESRGSQHSNPRRSLERRGSRERSVHHAKDDRDMQLEIDELKRELHHAQ